MMVAVLRASAKCREQQAGAPSRILRPSVRDPAAPPEYRLLQGEPLRRWRAAVQGADWRQAAGQYGRAHASLHRRTWH
eukprot:4831383-Lingulodinium_polyedra.AAC.1